jgi:hypothetical protein
LIGAKRTSRSPTRGASLHGSGVACAVASAIESASFAGDNILTGAAVLLGRAGIAACEADAGKMKKPLTIFLVEREDRVISWLITTIEVTLH